MAADLGWHGPESWTCSKAGRSSDIISFNLPVLLTGNLRPGEGLTHPQTHRVGSKV